ncbi:MAG TPA: hypothetical protein VK885_13735 [Desulfotignum sp.]|nr:hypothetical protein [Desulfotignum sp.]
MTVYPELFSDIDLKTEIKQFYSRFFNLDLDDAMVKKILNNQGMRQAMDPQ